ncbi:MAG TPA: Coenzyme F420 hydrogenase/dehydrogenase, beta subunit C-terminal domain, partial [Vicinamibacterales bacterium]|nr:Coenzyme F420 hydrogenase/dehydrogenase, beta subunit C-terminal domain [Vicinamibacterales bacterium]
KDGRVLTAPKFHYNYLIPLFITKGSLQLCDFTNELTDISVGDAWSPRYERTRGGYSVILARSDKSVALLQDLRARDVLALREISVHEALDMHGHMLDFKKRGSFIRNEWKDTRPDYGYCPAYVSSLRRLIERCLAVAFGLGRLTSTRWIVERLPLFLIGPCFNAMRISWKAVSKPTKRKGLAEIEFTAWS